MTGHSRYCHLSMGAIVGALVVATPARAQCSCQDPIVIDALPFHEVIEIPPQCLGLGPTPSCVTSYTRGRILLSYSPKRAQRITVGTCGAGFDTVLSIMSDEGKSACTGEDTQVTPLACNDDGCFGPDALGSIIQGFTVAPPTTYYFFIQRNFTGIPNMPFLFSVQDTDACAECPPGAIVESEPDCGLDGDEPSDSINGGCNFNPHEFQPLGDGDVFCGSLAATGADARDTDWFEVHLPERRIVELELIAEGSTQMGRPGQCADRSCYAELVEQVGCAPSTLATVLDAGDWEFVVAPLFHEQTDCDLDYRLEVVTRVPGDASDDDMLGVIDLLSLLVSWGPCPAQGACLSDTNLDGLVGVADLVYIIDHWDS